MRLNSRETREFLHLMRYCFRTAFAAAPQYFILRLLMDGVTLATSFVPIAFGKEIPHGLSAAALQWDEMTAPMGINGSGKNAFF